MTFRKFNNKFISHKVTQGTIATYDNNCRIFLDRKDGLNLPFNNQVKIYFVTLFEPYSLVGGTYLENLYLEEYQKINFNH